MALSMNPHKEYKLLLTCLGAADEESKPAAMSRWRAAEWDELVRQSNGHGVTPYLYHRLRALRPAVNIPDPIERRMREIFLLSASRNIRLYHELGKTLNALSDDGIPVIALKGAHLAELVYGNIALRPMTDVDIMVPRGDLHKAVESLIRSGFRALNEKLDGYLEWSAIHQYRILPQAKHFFDLVHPKWRVKLDVHCRLTPEDLPFTIESEGLWERAVPVRLGGAAVLALSPEDLLLYECLHTSFHHGFASGLRPFCDIHETLRRHEGGMDWESVQSRARQWGASRCVYLTLHLTRELMATAVPDGAMRALEPETLDSSLVTCAMEKVFFHNGIDHTLLVSLVHKWKGRGLRNKAAGFMKSIFRSPRFMATKYPVAPDSKRVYLYYAVRLKDLFARYWRTGRGLLIHRKEMTLVVKQEKKHVALEQWLMSKD